MLRLIQVGVGGWGESWASITKQSEDFEVVAYVDTSQEKLGALSKIYNVEPERCFTDLDRALAQTPADALLAVVPANVHAEVATKAIKAGLHVLVEKPLSDNMTDAKRIVVTAENHKRNLMVSQNYRFRKQPRTIQRLVASRFAGDPGYVSVNFHKSPPFTGIYYLQLPEPIITEMIIHHFDLMRYMLGLEPSSLYAKSWHPKWSWFKGNPTVEILVKMENDVLVNYFGSWVSRGWETTWSGDWRIECTEGEIHWSEDKVSLTLQEPTRTFKSVFTKGLVEHSNSLEAELVHMPMEDRWYSLHEFAQSITEQRDPETNGSENLRSLAMVMAAVESCKSGKWQEISSFID